MTGKPDTTREAVERLALALERGAWSAPPRHEVQMVSSANTLRALAADNDALRAEVAALRQAAARTRGEALEEATRVADLYSQGKQGMAASAAIVTALRALAGASPNA